MTREYEPRVKSKKELQVWNLATTGIVFLVAFITLKKFVMIVLGIKSVGIIGTIIIGMISAYFGHKAGNYVELELSNKTFYIEKDRISVLIHDTGEIITHKYDQIISNSLSKLKNKENEVREKSTTINTTETVKG